MTAIDRFSERVFKETRFLDRLDRNGARISGDGDTGTGFGEGLAKSLPADDFAQFMNNFHENCGVSLGRAFQGGLWPAIDDLWMPHDQVDAGLFLAAFDQAADRAPHEYYPPVRTGTVLEAFSIVADIAPAGDGIWATLTAATRSVMELAARSRNPGVYVVLYFLESLDEARP